MRVFLPGSIIMLAALLSGAAQAQVKIGVAAPFTGSSAAFGGQFRAGTEQAVEDLNAAGGIHGQKATLEFEDDAADPRQGVSVANRFAGNGVKFVVGHYNSGVMIPASEVYAENGILMITPSGTNPKVTERNMWNVFRTCGRDDQQAVVATDYILKNLKDKKIAILHDKTVAGRGLADEMKKDLNAGGVTEVLFEGITPGDKDYSAVVSKLKAKQTDLLYWTGLHTEGGLLVRQMREQGLNAVLMGADGIASEEYAAIAGPGADGTLMTFAPDPRKRPEAKEVVGRLQAKNINPESYTLYAYAAVQVIAEAAEKAKSLDPKVVANEIKSGMTFKTVIGDISYDKKGDVTRPDYVVYAWKKDGAGKITYSEIN